MQGPELTFTTLAQSQNQAAANVLISALSSSTREVRNAALRALLQRQESCCPEAVLAVWNAIDASCHQLLRGKKEWIAPALQQSLTSGDENLEAAIHAAKTLGVQSVLCALIDLAEKHKSEKIRVDAVNTVLELVHSLGRDARMNRGNHVLRGPVVGRLANCVLQYSKHRNPKLVDAFLMVITWSDAELRELTSSDSATRRIIADQLQTTQRISIIELLTGFVSNRWVPPFVYRILATRTEDVFRDSLLRAIGPEPLRTTLRNLTEIGLPQCCQGNEKLIDQISPDHLAAAVHLYNQTHTDLMGYLRMVTAAIEHGGPGCVNAATQGFMKCMVPDAKVWMKAAIVLSKADQTAIERNADASLLEKLIHLLSHSDAHLVRAVRRLLQPLQVEAMLPRLESLPPKIRRAMGQIVMMVDCEAIARIRDGLRHPVLKKRLAAIAAADALAAVDLLTDSFEHITREDHQEARVLACEVMARASSDATLSLLKFMADLPPCPVRDAAIKAIDVRTTTED